MKEMNNLTKQMGKGYLSDNTLACMCKASIKNELSINESVKMRYQDHLKWTQK